MFYGGVYCECLIEISTSWDEIRQDSKFDFDLRERGCVGSQKGSLSS